MSYIVIPSIRVRSANMINCQVAIGGPPVMAAVLFAHALAARARLGVDALGVALIHHAVAPLGERAFGVFYPQQRRAASYMFTNRADRDYSSKNKHALSLQPTASAHMRLSLVIETEQSTATPDAIADHLGRARLAGGQIAGHGVVAQHNDIEDAFKSLPSGYAVVDRRDMLNDRQHASQAHALVAALGAAPDADDGSWLSAACVGYAAITAEQLRAGGRDAHLGVRHAFAEPLVGLVQFRSLRMVTDPLERLIWRPEWLQDDVFVVRQS